MGKHFLLTLLAIFLGACGSDKNNNDVGYDDKLLVEYRQAIPSQTRLEAKSPNKVTRDVGDANLPNYAYGAVTAINGAAHNIVTMLKFVTSLPPTVYNSETKEFLWGPFDNDDGYGKAAVFIKENDPGDDFSYSYAFIRLPNNDLAQATPVIWGAATPDPNDEDKGVGMTLWDLEANRIFDETYDPNNAKNEQGRFVMLYGAGAEDDGDYTFNLAIFRNFKGENENDEINLDYYFGRWQGDDGNVLTFLDWEQQADICDTNQNCWEEKVPADSILPETLKIRLAFLNDGMGRGEGSVSGGDMNDSVDFIECWSQIIEQSYFAVNVSDPPNYQPIKGNAQACGAIFGNTLDELNIPSLADVDQETLTKMSCVAEHGIDAAQCNN